jgi:hypothetical protein
MSKMGRAVFWVQENRLEKDPDALKKYIEHLKKEEENERNRKARAEDGKESKHSV